MGLSSTLSNALGGMNASQRGIDTVSRNVANAGTPGYHKQSLVISETTFGTSAQVRTLALDRAFNQALEKQHLVAVSNASFYNVQAEYLDRLQMHLGKPGDDNSLDTLYASFENALQSMATNPNDLTTRAAVLNTAQAVVEQLNGLTDAVQEMRREAESQISNSVSELNRSLTALADVNVRILDLSQDATSRLALMDERDRLVASISELIDVKASYRNDGTVALMTESGIGVLDVEPSFFEFTSGGTLNASKLYDSNPDENGVGVLTLRTPSGLEIDPVAKDLLSSGRIAGLVELRDDTLVTVQDQLDEIAAGLAQALNTVTTDGTAVGGGGPGIPAGFEIDLSDVEPGNSVLVNYTDSTGTHTVRLVHSEDGTTLPSPNAAGEEVIALDLSDQTAAAAELNTALGPDVTFSDQGGGVLRVMDDGGVTSTIASMTGYGTPSDEQSGDLALNLFTDASDAAYTGSVDGTDQKVGFAGRIQINSAIVADSTLLVQYDAGISLGDADRPEFLLNALKSMQFVSEKVTALSDGGVRLTGPVSDMISQMINHQGNMVSKAQSLDSQNMATLESVVTKMNSEYGVNVDEEMARLIELQNAYSASARVVSTVQELIDALMRM
ncbi:flagellar hook-associated protein FlgK [Pelagibacterium halotolerans]|uniref:flagellar hook-associated protein FlgK n=1 Tax=Pelagibacterium halotolerans TaxID=531813 RepID=UPI00384D692F